MDLTRLDSAEVVISQLPTCFDYCNQVHPHRGLLMKFAAGAQNGLTQPASVSVSYQHLHVLSGLNNRPAYRQVRQL